MAPDSSSSAVTACERPATVAVADRISIAPDGNVLYQLHRPWPKPDSTRTHLTFEPVAFLRRLAALVPSPYQNLIRYHG
ncbi:transposase, partial [Myxococcota bacterium]|nr:transposase [Myxococcota bacterium]